jgi:hypothetical protein
MQTRCVRLRRYRSPVSPPAAPAPPGAAAGDATNTWSVSTFVAATSYFVPSFTRCTSPASVGTYRKSPAAMGEDFSALPRGRRSSRSSASPLSASKQLIWPRSVTV